MKRREFVRRAASLATLPLCHQLAVAAEVGQGEWLTPQRTHFPPRAKQLIFIFLTGGFSHIDTFDPKPRLATDHGKIVKAAELRGIFDKPILGSPFKFQRHGESGLEISELFPQLATLADDLCVIRTLHTDIVEHFQAALAMHTGSATVPMPSLGSWLSHGLGTFNPNLPPYVVIAEHLPYAGSQVWDCGFLPPLHQGVRIVPGDEPIPDLSGNVRHATLAELERAMLTDLNKRHADLRPNDLVLKARSASFDIARGMMAEAPEVFDLASESNRTLEEFGTARDDRTSFAYQCVIARRLIERGVRVVEIIDTGTSDNWDSHGDMAAHVPKARRVDQAIRALIVDLKRRGLLGETLIAIATEFGRTPWTDTPTSKGRSHHAQAFTCLLTGAGVKGGIAYGSSDEYGIGIAEDPVHVHDYHATILHLMGLDHTKLTYRHAGRDFRLTDVSGNVIHPILV